MTALLVKEPYAIKSSCLVLLTGVGMLAMVLDIIYRFFKRFSFIAQ